MVSVRVRRMKIVKRLACFIRGLNHVTGFVPKRAQLGLR
jgi:hypothetical protein